MAKVRIIENTLVSGKHAERGEVLEVDVTVARQLLVAGKAVPAPVEPEKPMTRTRTKKVKA